MLSPAITSNIDASSKGNSDPSQINFNVSSFLRNNEGSLSEAINSFRCRGFAVFHGPLLENSDVDRLNVRLEKVLRGEYDRQRSPDRAPPIFSDTVTEVVKGPPSLVGSVDSSSQGRRRVLQVVNIHKCDKAFRSLATNAQLGELIAKLTGWQGGVRLASDQTWVKLPGSRPISFHRDSPYFMFTPSDVVTVWVALDDMTDDSLGPLEYVSGSHLWGDNESGKLQQFFGRKKNLNAAAKHQGIPWESLDFVSMKGLRAGSISIHDGRIWHGSGENTSPCKPRRGLGLHYVPGQVRFTEAARGSSLWRHYLNDDLHSKADDIPFNEEDFPLIYAEKHNHPS
jgi:ectoine hydroxylase-related dioxygenase (phytanoyl-CoA dioxygenase family)